MDTSGIEFEGNRGRVSLAYMKKIDKLILKSFLGPFFLTFVVVVFILLTQTLIKYFDEFVGKDLGFAVFSELIFYFSLTTTPVALPLAMLLSTLICFGNLGEHYELTAIKSSGISLIRVLFPIFIFAGSIIRLYRILISMHIACFGIYGKKNHPWI